MVFLSPPELLRLSIRAGLMITEAQLAIGLRLMGLPGLWLAHLPQRAEPARAPKTDRAEDRSAAGAGGGGRPRRTAVSTTPERRRGKTASAMRALPPSQA